MTKPRIFDMLTPVIAPGATHDDVVHVDFPFRLQALVAHEGDSIERAARLGPRSYDDCGDAFDVVAIIVGADHAPPREKERATPIGVRLKGTQRVDVGGDIQATSSSSVKLTVRVKNVSGVARTCHYDIVGEEP